MSSAGLTRGLLQPHLAHLTPHVHAQGWPPSLFWLHVAADALTAAAFVAIPLMLLVLWRRRRADLPFPWLFVAFAVLLLACGATHALEIWNLTQADYWLSGFTKALTAAAALTTAVTLWRLLPAFMRLPSPHEVERVNRELTAANASLRASEETLRAAHAALQEKSEILAAVTEAMQTYLDTGNWKKAHGLLLRCALVQTQSEYGFIGVMVPGPRLRVLAHEGIRWEDHFGREACAQAMQGYAQHGYLEFPNLDNLFGRVVTAGEIVVCHTPPEEPAPGAPPPERPPLRSFLGVPVRNEKQVVGAIGVANRSGGYDAGAQMHLQTIAQQAGVLCDSYRRSLREASLEEQVRTAQKMEAVGLLAGGVAHDFNNLLQVIQGYTTFALDSSAPWPDRRMNLEQVRRAAERATALTQQLLAFGRRQTLQKVDLALNDTIADLLRMIRRVIGEQISVDFIPGHELGNLHADRAQIDQVLLNLCLNARDALPQGGRITIETENVLINGAFRESHPWAKSGRYVLVSVTDNGVGMDKETASRVFEPFFTTKPKGQGTGLGLAVVYGVVKQHDGMVNVYSEPGKGTTFKIYLPIVARSAASVGPKHTPLRSCGTETILIAEDEPMVRDLAQRILQRAGYRVLVAADGNEACALFREHADAVALAVLDVVMPRLGGREAYERMRALRPGLPAIFCSGYAGSALEPDAPELATAQLLAKPYGADELLERVRTTLDRRPQA